MKKIILISLIILLGVAAAVSVSAATFGQQKTFGQKVCEFFLPRSMEWRCFLFGAAYTPVFPGTLSNWQEEDIIEEEWANILERAIGTTTLNVSLGNATTSLYYLTTNTNSSNPGHTHTTSTITGITYVKQIAEGGTATTTFIQGLVTASGTNAFGTLATNGSGSIPIASGTQFVANTLTAGANVTISNSSGSITIASSAATATSTTIVPRPAGIVFATSSLGFGGAQTTVFLGLYNVPYQVSVAKMTYEITSVNTPGTFDVGIYSLDGQQKIVEFTTQNLGTAGVTSTSFTATTLQPGLYYIGWILNGAFNVSFAMYYLSSNGINSITDEPVMSGETESTANTLPATIPPTTLTFGNYSRIIRFDN